MEQAPPKNLAEEELQFVLQALAEVKGVGHGSVEVIFHNGRVKYVKPSPQLAMPEVPRWERPPKVS